MHDIQLLLRVSHDERDEQWLTDALQAAIKLEHATLPIYLTALWSIEDERSAVAKTIKDVAIEEMGHFGLACNMLAAITPSDRRIPIDTAGMVPSFPAKGLPGNVLPNVRVYLAGLSKELVNRVFMTIEAPVKPLVAQETYRSIGDFYEAILATYLRLIDDGTVKMTPGRQVTHGRTGIFPIGSPGDVKRAITKIKEQGEGTRTSPFAEPRDSGGQEPHELAHFYRFAELFYGRRIRQEAPGRWGYDGDPIPWPAVRNVPEIPAGGYQDGPAVLADFDHEYTAMLRALHGAWNGGQGSISEAVGKMMSMKRLAKEIMKHELPEGRPGFYGPCWRYTDRSTTSSES